MSQLNLHRGPSVEELSPLWQGWSLTLTHPQKLFDINCRSHIISCHSLSRIYGWSHWLGAEPSIKLLRGLTLSPLHQGPIFPECRLNMQIHTGGRVILKTRLCTELSAYKWPDMRWRHEADWVLSAGGRVKRRLCCIAAYLRVREEGNYMKVLFENKRRGLHVPSVNIARNL